MPYREPARRRTRYLRLCLDVLARPTGCSSPWEKMEGDGCTRVCHECLGEVHDVTLMPPAEAEEFLAERMGVAPKLELLRRPDGRVMESECGRGAAERRRSRVLYALLLASATGFLFALFR